MLVSLQVRVTELSYHEPEFLEIYNAGMEAVELGKHTNENQNNSDN
jgi:hypothetical protein